MTSRPIPLSRVIRVLRARDLLTGVEGPEDAAISGVCQDSRKVAPGDLFLAWRGVDADAHDFVADAVRGGAAAAVVERPVPGLDVPQVVVKEGRLAGALAADAVLGSPWRDIETVGITGTNGKTTTALLLRHLLSARGPTAAVGTLGLVEDHGSVRPGTEALTTPGPVQLLHWLRELADEGYRAVVLEASSHALAQRRLDALRFDVAVFTNLGLDHLDYHEDLDDYRSAKARLLELLDEGSAAVVNADDPAWIGLPQAPRRITFGVEADADLRAEAVELRPEGARFRMSWRGVPHPVRLPLIGRFNVENALGAAGAALALGDDAGRVAAALARAPQVPGRLERVADRPCPVLIDFAHTPDALRRVLDTLRPLVRGRLIVVFGAGGDRDRSKRRPMAEAVARRADVAIATSDNPRTEDPDAILDDLEAGLAGVPHEREVDRRKAIALALGRVRGEDDLVLLAGKGHERYQVVGAEKRPFDERLVIREILE
ncbi:MAG: UDP-N-acetylmuramoyl-L-alanyl-D-glutamate--2,6-diaminopimelate ligase [Gemmatimonadota bacterium]